MKINFKAMDRYRPVGSASGSASSRARKDRVFYGIKPLSQQIREMRRGGMAVPSRDLNDSNYDEDDVFEVDPCVDQLDRFETSEAIVSRISDRMKAKHKDKLDHAEV